MLGPGVFVIAEAGVNHNGRLDLALRLVDAACRARADAVKFQSFKAERLATPRAARAAYQGDGAQLDMLRRLELSEADQTRVAEHCQARGILFLSTPFEEESARFLHDRLQVPAFKVSSGDLTNLPFLRFLAGLGKPLLLSTGMAWLHEVAAAVTAVREAGARHLVLLHCVSQYPAPAEAANLRAMATMAQAFDTPVGYSDHTTGIDVALAAVALGAVVLEKHFTLARDLPGPDHAASLEPAELADLVRAVRRVEAALGTGVKAPHPVEREVASVARKSLVASCPLPPGTVLQAEHVTAARPGDGLSPALLPAVLGRRVRTGLAAGDLLTWEALQ